MSPHNGSARGGEQPRIAPRLLADHERWLRLVVFARVGDSHAVDEVMQEVALALARGGKQPKRVEQVSAWLYRVAVRQCLVYRRKHGRHRRFLDRVAREAAPDCTAGADSLTWLLSRERADLVRRAMRRLPPRDAEILLLKYADEWSAPALARHLGVSVSAIEARLHRARGKLRELLTQWNVVEVEAGRVIK